MDRRIFRTEKQETSIQKTWIAPNIYLMDAASSIVLAVNDEAIYTETSGPSLYKMKKPRILKLHKTTKFHNKKRMKGKTNSEIDFDNVIAEKTQ